MAVIIWVTENGSNIIAVFFMLLRLPCYILSLTEQGEKMKKIVVLLGILLCGTGVAFAQSGLRVGDNYISISLGGGNSTDKAEQVFELI